MRALIFGILISIVGCGGGTASRPPPDPSARPAGSGWYCFAWIYLAQPMSRCVREEAACQSGREGVLHDVASEARIEERPPHPVTDCATRPKAFCYVDGTSPRCHALLDDCERALESTLTVAESEYSSEQRDASGITGCVEWE